MPPIDTTALTAIFAWVWDQYGKSIVDRAGKAAWERLRWEDRSLAYARKVQRLYGTMQVLGQPRPVSLEGIYTAISLLDRPTALSRYTVEELQDEFTRSGSRYFHASDKDKRRDGLEMVKGGANLFILGKPGAGKTTFLKHVALRGVNGDLGRVPIFIGLKQLSDSGLNVFDFVINEFDVCDFPDADVYLDRLLKAGKAILLFDGLDEVNIADDERQRLITDVENFTRKYDQCQCLITCRLAANDYLFQGYTYVEMSDFNEDQIREFVTRWFQDDEKRRELFLSELQKSETEGLRELARVPLLLALLCLGFEETLKLSSRRVELYEEALDALLKKWDAGRNIRRDEIYRELSLKRKEQMLAQVAARTFDKGEYFVPKKTLARGFENFLSRVPDAPQDVDGETILLAIIAQHGLFMERAHDIYSFAHLTFQEYFTARYVVENEARGTLPRLIAHYDDPRYREIILMTAAQLADAGVFFELFNKRLAADAQKRPAVAALLRQVERKAASATDGVMSPLVTRSAYLTLALTHALALNRHRSFTVDHAIDNAIECVPYIEQALDLGRDLHLALDLALDLSRDIAFNLDLAFDLDFNLEHNYYSLFTRDIALVNARLLLENSFRVSTRATVWPRKLRAAAKRLLHAAATQSRTLNNIKLSERLDALAIQVDLLRPSSQPGFTKKVTTELYLALKEADLVFPPLEGQNRVFISNYLGGIQLLVDCLDQAIVADREVIKEGLLLLPPES